MMIQYNLDVVGFDFVGQLQSVCSLGERSHHGSSESNENEALCYSLSLYDCGIK